MERTCKDLFLPPSMGNLKALTALDLSNNGLSGTLPNNIFNLPSLSYVIDISDNYLVGTIPIEIGNLIMVERLFLSRNHF